MKRIQYLSTSLSLRKHLEIISGTLLVLILSFSACNRQLSETVTDQSAGFNGSFEHSEKGVPFNWIFYTQKTTGSGDFDVVLDTTTPKDGVQSLKFNVRQCDDRGGRLSPGMAQEIAVNEGETYHISFWIRNEGAEYLVKLNAVNSSDRAEGPKHNSSETIKEWRLYEYNYTIPASMNRLRFELNILKPGVLSIDEIKIEKVNTNK